MDDSNASIPVKTVYYAGHAVSIEKHEEIVEWMKKTEISAVDEKRELFEAWEGYKKRTRRLYHVNFIGAAYDCGAARSVAVLHQLYEGMTKQQQLDFDMGRDLADVPAIIEKAAEVRKERNKTAKKNYMANKRAKEAGKEPPPRSAKKRRRYPDKIDDEMEMGED